MDLQRTVQYLQELSDALTRATSQFIGAVPVLTKQHMERLATQKLNSTRQDYIDALKVKLDGTILVVELDPENWLANAVETGIDGYDMKATHLKSPKARLSKKGFRYMRIPMSKSKEGKGGPSPQGQALQTRIREVLMNKPAFGLMRTKTLMDGRVIEQQKLNTAQDPLLKGFYRMRSYDSFDDFHRNKNSRKPWQYVLFRTMSENPMQRSQWKHPGIKPVHIFRDTERWLEEAVPALAESVYGAEIEAVNKKFGA